MKVERAIQRALVLSLASAAISLPQTTLVRADASTPSPPSATIMKGTAHVACAYIIYLTSQVTLNHCFPNDYPLLRQHVHKWIPIMRTYADGNAMNESQKFSSEKYNRDWEKFGQSLNEQTCVNYRPSVEQLSRILTADLTKTEQGLEQMLRQSDDRNTRYAVCKR